MQMQSKKFKSHTFITFLQCKCRDEYRNKRKAENGAIDLQWQPVSQGGVLICGALCRARHGERTPKSRKSARRRETIRKASAHWGGGGMFGSPFPSATGAAIYTSQFAP